MKLFSIKYWLFGLSILTVTLFMGLALLQGYKEFNAYSKQQHEIQLHTVMQVSADITRLYRALNQPSQTIEEQSQLFNQSLFALQARLDNLMLRNSLLRFDDETSKQTIANYLSQLINRVDELRTLQDQLEETSRNDILQQLDSIYTVANRMLVIYYRESITYRETQVTQIERLVSIFLQLLLFALGLTLLLIISHALNSKRLRLYLHQEKQLKAQKQLYIDTLETSPVATAIIDLTPPAQFIYANHEFEELTGYSPNNYQHLDNIVSPGADFLSFEALLSRVSDAAFNAELHTQHACGTPFTQHLIAKRIQPEKANHPILVIHKRDITEQRRQAQRMEREANYDNLTNIPNRSLGSLSLKLAIEQARRKTQMLAVLFIDLDDFKLINDTMGHNAGDQLLASVAQRLSTRLRGSDLLCRLGGDEFMVLLNQIINEEDVALVANTIIEELNRVFMIQETSVQISCSIGAAIYPKDGLTTELLMKHADIAMYDAKQNGANQLRFYRPELNERNEREQILKGKAAFALQNAQIEPYFQPIVNLNNNQIIGAEALMRWIDENGSFISPAEFIPMLERSPLIWDITRLTLEHSLKFAIQSRQLVNKNFYVSINLSPVLFWHQSTSIAEIIIEAFNQKGFEPSMLRVELTESVFIRNYDKVRAEMAKLRTLGIKIMLDDFGTGYSSLSYLQRMPIDVIKIDRSFIHHIVFEAKNQAIVRATIEMARSIRCTVVAEGVEEESDIDYLKKLNCDFYQGYYCSPAIPSEQFLAQFSNHELPVKT